MPLSHRSLSFLVLCPAAAMMLAACSPQTQSSPLTASAIEPARIDAPLETPTVEMSPLEEAPSAQSPSVYRSSSAQRRFEKKQRGCQADPVPDECIN